jgi:hypothetical protein
MLTDGPEFESKMMADVAALHANRVYGAKRGS